MGFNYEIMTITIIFYLKNKQVAKLLIIKYLLQEEYNVFNVKRNILNVLMKLQDNNVLVIIEKLSQMIANAKMDFFEDIRSNNCITLTDLETSVIQINL